jgi:hypothetical protein
MPQKRLEKPDFAPPAETALETVRTSRRGLFLGMFAVGGALGLTTASSPAKAAVSMLRTGLNPDQPETGENALAEVEDAYGTEGELEEVGYRWGRRRRRRWRRRRRPRVGVRVWI